MGTGLRADEEAEQDERSRGVEAECGPLVIWRRAGTLSAENIQKNDENQLE